VLDHDLVKKTFKENRSLTKTGKIFGVSRQRIDQIVKGYLTVQMGTKARKVIGLPCSLCKQKSTIVCTANKLPYCLKCHNLVHSGRIKRTEVYNQPCVKCGKKLNAEVQHYGHYYCVNCVTYYLHRNDPNYVKPIKYTNPNCLVCNKTIIVTGKYEGLCHACYARKRYHSDPRVRKTSLKRSAKYWAKNHRTTASIG
jgi:hypothetical protein